MDDIGDVVCKAVVDWFFSHERSRVFKRLRIEDMRIQAEHGCERACAEILHRLAGEAGRLSDAEGGDS